MRRVGVAHNGEEVLVPGLGQHLRAGCDVVGEMRADQRLEACRRVAVVEDLAGDLHDPVAAVERDQRGSRRSIGHADCGLIGRALNPADGKEQRGGNRGERVLAALAAGSDHQRR